jgi:hypothetical protein
MANIHLLVNMLYHQITYFGSSLVIVSLTYWRNSSQKLRHTDEFQRLWISWNDNPCLLNEYQSNSEGRHIVDTLNMILQLLLLLLMSTIANDTLNIIGLKYQQHCYLNVSLKLVTYSYRLMTKAFRILFSHRFENN